MSETNETEGKTAGARARVAQRAPDGRVRPCPAELQPRSVESVLVEKKKRRAIGRAGWRSPPRTRPNPSRPSFRPKRPSRKPRTRKPAAVRVVLPQLSEDEKDARMRALTEARQREAAEREKVKETAAVQVVTEEQRAKEREEADERKRKEDERHEAETKARKVGEETARKHLLKEEADEPRARPMRVTRRARSPRGAAKSAVAEAGSRSSMRSTRNSASAVSRR